MTDKRKAFAPITDDIDSRIEAMARAKGVPSLTAPEAVLPIPTSALAREPDYGAGGQPVDALAAPDGRSAQAASPPKTKVTPVKSFVPDYAFMEIKLRAARERVSINHIVLKALHAAGYHIKPEDMIEDGRRLRGKRGGTHSIDALAELLRSQGLVIEQHRKTN
ncbi:hypothetical protein [Hyphomicrobium sp.]|uniref:hypothetical protein n=1 Tax=Hyphomicrobium sp. TaxID=82 RepID=UPI002E35FEF2|nr:hypothetical protein [Hyphomicrobium sp.]HEX2839941.1 hypothetical protein [Hyphomicrobium sp.]